MSPATASVPRIAPDGLNASDFAPRRSPARPAKRRLRILLQALVDVARRHQPELVGVLGAGRHLEPHPRADGARASGAGHLVPAAVDRRGEHRDAPPPSHGTHGGPRRGRRRLREGAFGGVRQGRQGGRRSTRCSRTCASGRPSPRIRPRPSASRRWRNSAGSTSMLRELELPRWTERERDGLMTSCATRSSCVWMTGELHLEKATVEREVAWGLHFFDETMFEMLPETMDPSRPRRRSTIRTRLRGAAVLPVRLLDRRRSRRQPFRHRGRDPSTLRRNALA